jgi:hypothetical protein
MLLPIGNGDGGALEPGKHTASFDGPLTGEFPSEVLEGMEIPDEDDGDYGFFRKAMEAFRE